MTPEIRRKRTLTPLLFNEVNQVWDSSKLFRAPLQTGSVLKFEPVYLLNISWKFTKLMYVIHFMIIRAYNVLLISNGCYECCIRIALAMQSTPLQSHGKKICLLILVTVLDLKRERSAFDELYSAGSRIRQEIHRHRRMYGHYHV